VVYVFCNVSVIVGMSMSGCIVVFLTYHGALVAILRIRFCNVCIFEMCVLAAEFHNGAPYCQMGLIKEMYMRRFRCSGVLEC
jgi:hypothetical protein